MSYHARAPRFPFRAATARCTAHFLLDPSLRHPGRDIVPLRGVISRQPLNVPGPVARNHGIPVVGAKGDLLLTVRDWDRWAGERR